MEGVQHFSAEYTQYIYTLFSANPTKITTVVVSLALAVAETTLPLLANSQASKKSDVGDLIFKCEHADVCVVTNCHDPVWTVV